MKLKYVATFTTSLVIISGLAMISPIFFRSDGSDLTQRVMLSFNITEFADVVEWSQDLAAVLDTEDTGSSIFIAGNVAQQHPQVVSCFGDQVDIGSRTYSNLDLTQIQDYLVKLDEVNDGKMAVNDAGNLNSRLFCAPFGATDQDIYSLLSRCEILADFSYENQYNVYRDGQFIKYSAIVYRVRDHTPDFLLSLPETKLPIIIVFESGYPISEVQALIDGLKQADVEFLNASALADLSLTLRGGNFDNNQTALR